VWIEELDIRGFGRLRGRYDFSCGLTLVVGMNEAGKSTLHEALVRTLFGFSRRERRRQEGQSEKDFHRPWSGEPFGVNAIVQREDGTRLRIEWDFEGHSVRLLHAATGEDLSGEVLSGHGDTTLGRYLVGLDLDEFRHVCCLEQAAVGAVPHTEGLVLALRHAVENAGREKGVEAAIEILNGFLRDPLGIHIQHLRALPGGRLASLHEKLAKLRDRRERIVAARAEVERLAGELSEKLEASATLRQEALYVEQAVLLAESQELGDRVELARGYDERSRDLPASVGLVSEQDVIEIRERLSELRRLEQAVAALQETVDALRPDWDPLERKRQELAGRVEALASSAALDTRHETGLRDLAGRRAALSAERRNVEPIAIPDRDPMLMRYQTERAWLAELEGSVQKRGLRGAVLVVVIVVALASLGLAVAVHPAFGLGLVASAAIALWSWRAARPRREEFRAALACYGAGSLAELDARLAQQEASIAARRVLSEERERQSTSLDRTGSDLDREIARLLDEVGAPGTGADVERVTAYLLGCVNHAERTRWLAELEAVNAELGTVRQPSRDLETRRRELDDLRHELAGRYAALGIDAGDLDAAGSAFERLLEEDKQALAQFTEARTAGQALKAVLGNETLDSLERRASEAASRHEDHVTRHGRLPIDASDRRQLEKRQADLGRQIRDLDLLAESLRTRIQEREDGDADVAPVEEEIADTERGIARVEVARDAIKVARDVLREAARETHRTFAPHLNAALERNLPRITDGRYRKAVVGEDLQIQVEAPEHGRMVPVDLLSRGTQDQIYLVERLEIASLLDRTMGAAPMLLDDPFAHFDAVRLRLALTVLGEVARERQVVLFSEDAGLVDELRELCPECTVITLPPPSAPDLEARTSKQPET
jgi:DNA repair exonuclease SbcCD ATPase subunit